MMLGKFDYDALFSLIKDLYTVIGIRISIFDDAFNVVAEYPAEPPAICALIRSSATGRDACRACDKSACVRAKKLLTAHVYQCHAGITEAITPIQFGGGVLGYAIFAHMLPDDDKGGATKNIADKCAGYGLDEKKIFEAAKDLKTHSAEKIMASIRLLDAIAAYLQIKKLATWKNEDIGAQLQAFVEQNLDKDLNSALLCRHFYISRTKLYQLSVKAFGTGIMQYILSRRIEKAKELLSTANMSVSGVAKSVGISDYNYFCKVFKKHTGCPPSKYRN